MGIDGLFMEFVHGMCVACGGFFTPFLRVISLLGEKCWIFFLISLLLCLNKKTRWIGLTAFLAVLIGGIIGSIGLKSIIMRMRPYTANNLYQDYWQLAGAFPKTNYSMPSGHVLGCTAFFVSLYITSKKDIRPIISTIGIISVILMAISRMYFMHHYFTDCVAGAIIGVIVSFIAKQIVRFIHKVVKENENIGLFRFILNFDLFNRRHD